MPSTVDINHNPMTEKWTRQGRDVVLDTPWLKVYKDRYRLPNNHFIPDYYIWEGRDAALCVCQIGDQALLVRQYRPGVEKPTLCHPGGRLDPTDTSPLAGAVRELLEETGYSPKSTVSLGSFAQIPAISPNRVHIFLVACEKKPIDMLKLDKSENIETKLIPLTDLPDLIGSGEMDCVACVAASYLALFHSNLK